MMKTFRKLYTSQKDMYSEVQQLSKECADILSVSVLDDLGQEEGHLQLHLVTVNSPYQKGHKMGAYYLFGEHPRELISSELALFFLKDICNGYHQQDP